MLTNVTSRRWIVLIVGALLVGGALAGAVVGAQFREVLSPEELDAALRKDALIRVADISADRGLPGRGVFAQPTSNGLLCLWDAPSATALARQGGCNPADDPFGGRQMTFSFAYEGGPAIDNVTDARLVGLTSSQVSAVEVIMSDGSRRKVALHKTPKAVGEFHAFGHRFGRGEIRRGVTPTAVVALNEAGTEIDRQATGF